MNGLAQVIGCLLMYGIGINESLSLAPWRVLFLVCGSLTVFAGVLFYFFMPSGPKDAWFLTERQKQVLSMRMARDREGGDKTSFSMAQLREALLDVKTWFVFWFGVLVTMQSPVLTFASLVINNIGYDRYRTMLYLAPSGAVQIALLWIGVIGCMLFPNNRTYVALALVIPPLIGTVLLLQLSLDAGWGMIASAWLVSLCPYRPSSQILTSSGLVHHSCLVYPPLPHRLERQGQHEACHRQCHVLHRLLCRLHCLAAAVDAEASLLLRRRHQHRHLVHSVRRHCGIPLCLRPRQQRS